MENPISTGCEKQAKTFFHFFLIIVGVGVVEGVVMGLVAVGNSLIVALYKVFHGSWVHWLFHQFL